MNRSRWFGFLFRGYILHYRVFRSSGTRLTPVASGQQLIWPTGSLFCLRLVSPFEETGLWQEQKPLELTLRPMA